MCGIAAIVSNASGHVDVSPILHDMLGRLAHRGPDGSGLHVDGKAGIGMTRLSIVGGPSGQQPIWNERRTVAVVCNGEIYNYQVLRTDLQERGHRFSTDSDVEVIVHLYEEHQLECVRFLEGTFAFVLWDADSRMLLACRDRIGVKPLYHARLGRDVVFASELQALAAHPRFRLNLHPQALDMYLGLRFVPGPDTVASGIHKLQPGHFAVLRGGKLTILPYWKPALPAVDGTGEPRLPKNARAHKYATLREKLVEAVSSQLAPGVKSSVLLSGGLDSTALLALQKLVSGRAPSTLTVAFDPPAQHTRKTDYSELGEARAVAEAFGSQHVFEQYSAREVLAVLPDILRSLDEPVADPTAIPLWFVSRLARQLDNRVVFSGEGLDELFTGYEAHRQAHWIRRMQHIPRSWRLHGETVVKRLGLPGRGVLRRSVEPVWNWYQGVGAAFSGPERASLLMHPFARSRETGIEQYVQSLLADYAHASPLTQMTMFDVFAWLPENTLVKSDKLSMAHGVELRVPFLDREVVEYAFEFDDHEKLRGQQGKYAVRQALHDLIPQWVLKRRKAGFPVPITAWMFGEWSDYVRETLLASNAATAGLLRRDQIARLFDVPPQQRRRAARLLWNLFILEMWYARSKVETPAPASRYEAVRLL